MLLPLEPIRVNTNSVFVFRTPTFDLREVGETHLKVQEENVEQGLLRADVAVSGAIVFVTVNAEERGYPISIENSSDFDFILSQAVSDSFRNTPAHKLTALSRRPLSQGRGTMGRNTISVLTKTCLSPGMIRCRKKSF